MTLHVVYFVFNSQNKVEESLLHIVKNTHQQRRSHLNHSDMLSLLEPSRCEKNKCLLQRLGHLLLFLYRFFYRDSPPHFRVFSSLMSAIP